MKIILVQQKKTVPLNHIFRFYKGTTEIKIEPSPSKMPRRKNPGDLEKNKNPGEKNKTGKYKKNKCPRQARILLGILAKMGILRGKRVVRKKKIKTRAKRGRKFSKK